MSRRDDQTLLQDMMDAARSAVAAVAGRDEAALASNRVWTLGLVLVKCLEIIGEAAGRLSADFRTRHSGVPWPQIIGMRNRLVHAYFEIDYEQVWKALTEDLPPLIGRWEAIVASEPGTQTQNYRED